MKKKGFPKLRGGSRGDQLVRIQVMTPQALKGKEKELLNKLADLNGKGKTTFSKINM